MSKMLKLFTYLKRLTLKLKFVHIIYMTWLISGCMPAIDSSLVSTITATPSSSNASVAATLDNRVLRLANGDNLLPLLPTDLTFAIPQKFNNMVSYDSGASESRVLLMGSNELLDGHVMPLSWLVVVLVSFHHGEFHIGEMSTLYCRMVSCRPVNSHGFNICNS